MKILVLSFWTPPIVRPQSILIGKMIPEWIRQGVEPIIVTYDVCGDWNINAPVYKIRQYKPSGLLSRIPILKNLAEYRYYGEICKTAMAAAAKHKPDLIFSFANPQASNILGAMLAKRMATPFVSHFSDPWYDNPYSPPRGLSGFKTKLLERFVIKNSQKVIFTNERARELVMQKYPPSWQKRGEVVYHCFDPRDYPARSPDPNHFTISYIGAFYKERNPQMIFGALGNILKESPSLKTKLKVRLVGSANPYAGYSQEVLDQEIVNYGLKVIAEVVPPVSYEESLRYMRESNCLVVVDADFPDSPFLPSKVIDYIGSGQPTIGITPADSPTAKVLQGAGYPSFDYHQQDTLTSYVKKIILGTTPLKPNSEYIYQFEVRNTTARLIKIFHEASHNPRH